MSKGCVTHEKNSFFVGSFFFSAVALTILAIGKILMDRERVPYGINPIEINKELLWGTVFVGVLSMVFTGLELIVEKWKDRGSTQK